MKGTAGTAHRSAGDGWLRSFKRERLHQGRCLSCSGLPCQLTSAGAPGGRRAAAVRFVEFLAVVMSELVVYVCVCVSSGNDGLVAA